MPGLQCSEVGSQESGGHAGVADRGRIRTSDTTRVVQQLLRAAALSHSATCPKITILLSPREVRHHIRGAPCVIQLFSW
jgi:hypothetical protein